MKPEEKAKELVENFAETIPPKVFGVLMERDWITAKKCALVAVGELISWSSMLRPYWIKVKEEINKM